MELAKLVRTDFLLLPPSDASTATVSPAYSIQNGAGSPQGRPALIRRQSNEKPEVQRGERTCPRSYSESRSEQGERSHFRVLLRGESGFQGNTAKGQTQEE